MSSVLQDSDNRVNTKALIRQPVASLRRLNKASPEHRRISESESATQFSNVNYMFEEPDRVAIRDVTRPEESPTMRLSKTEDRVERQVDFAGDAQTELEALAEQLYPPPIHFLDGVDTRCVVVAQEPTAVTLFLLVATVVVVVVTATVGNCYSPTCASSFNREVLGPAGGDALKSLPRRPSLEELALLQRQMYFSQAA